MKQTFFSQLTRPNYYTVSDLNDKVVEARSSLQTALEYNQQLITDILHELDIYKAIYNQLTGDITHSYISNVKPTTVGSEGVKGYWEREYSLNLTVDKLSNGDDYTILVYAKVYSIHGVYTPVLSLRTNSSEVIHIDMNAVWNFETLLCNNINEITFTYNNKGLKVLYEVYYSMVDHDFKVGAVKAVKAITDNTGELDLSNKLDDIKLVTSVKSFEHRDIINGIQDNTVLVHDQSIVTNVFNLYFDKLFKE